MGRVCGVRGACDGETVVEVGLENASDRSLLESGHLQEADIWRTRARAVADRRGDCWRCPRAWWSGSAALEVGSIACTHADGRRGERPIGAR